MNFFKEVGYKPSKKVVGLDLKQLRFIAIFVLIGIAIFLGIDVIPKEMQNSIYILLASINLFFILMRVVNYVFIQKNFIASYSLPLHVCSFNVFLCFIASITHSAIIMDYVFAMSPCFAFLALVFPESDAAKYPHFNFRSIEYYLSHTLLMVVPFIPIRYMGFVPSISYFTGAFVILLITCTIAGIVNLKSGGNYMYINHAPKRTPLEIVEKGTGKPIYRVIIVISYIVFYFIAHFIWNILF